jgi:GAF domain-containing protein
VSRADVEMNVPSQIVFKREHDPTDAVPLTYREYVFLVPPDTNETAAEALLRTQLELVLASLARVPPGKLVNLGVFDVAFQGRPPVRPLATLMWKDWRGSPVVEFPRRAGYVPHPIAAPPAVAAQPIAPNRSASQPPPPLHPQSVPPPPPTVSSSASPSAAAAGPAPHAPAPASAQVWAAPPVAAPVAPAPVAFARQVPAQSPAPQPRTRVRGEDLISELFESMHDLHFLGDAIEGGDFCLNLAMERIPSQAGLVHLYDIDRREFLVTSTRGSMAKSLLLRRHAEGDAVLSAAMGKRRALVVADAAQSEAAALDRYVALGGARSLIVAPVMQSGRFLGAIELMNPLDGQPYTEGEGNALTYIAEQFAEFVASRGVVTDPARIGSRMS